MTQRHGQRGKRPFYMSRSQYEYLVELLEDDLDNTEMSDQEFLDAEDILDQCKRRLEAWPSE